TPLTWPACLWMLSRLSEGCTSLGVRESLLSSNLGLLARLWAALILERDELAPEERRNDCTSGTPCAAKRQLK
ncbi:hypothetical protein SARC_15700, partial [Sphaeroforma arctica JP610]